MIQTGPRLIPLRIIQTVAGDVRHGLKKSDDGYSTFGEAYFSLVDPNTVKGWKRHRRMTLNIIVVVGEIRFVIYDDKSLVEAVNLTPDRPSDYMRLTLPPGYWMAFGGVGPGPNMLLNVADIEHDPAETESLPIERFAWSWDT